jgi:hypothetical protein
MNLIVQYTISIVSVIAVVALVRVLKLGGDVRIRDEGHARQIADACVSGFEAVDMIIDQAGIAAILKDANGRQLLIRRHGAHFVGRVLDSGVVARLDRKFLTLATAERSFGEVTLNLGEQAQYWASGLRYLRNG